MTKQELPQCSMEGCFNAAGVIFNGTLLCEEHANERSNGGVIRCRNSTARRIL
jgi:hypothetical protein